MYVSWFNSDGTRCDGTLVPWDDVVAVFGTRNIDPETLRSALSGEIDPAGDGAVKIAPCDQREQGSML